MLEITLFDYIKENLDTEGVFQTNFLPDKLEDANTSPLGTLDAFSYSVDTEVDTEAGEAVAKLLQYYGTHPGLEARRRLTDQLNNSRLASLADSFLENFTTENLTEEHLDLAEDYFYHSTTRETIKFAYLIFGLYGMENIKEDNPELWQDLLTVAHCEEFTFHFIYACRITNFLPQEELWQLLFTTTGWGRVYAINSIECTTPEQRQWLLEKGVTMDVEYPPLAVRMLEQTKLSEVLKAEQLSPASYRGAVSIVNRFFMLLVQFEPAVINQNFNTSSIDLYQIVKDLLRHAQAYAQNPSDVSDLVFLGYHLRSLIQAENWFKLSHNQCQELQAQCDSLIFSQNWAEILPQQLFDAEGKLNYDNCQLAYNLEIDCWEQLLPYFYENPTDTQLLGWLLMTNSSKYAPQIIKFIEEHLSLYINQPSLLELPMRYLFKHPGQGVSIITTSLLSVFELTRTVACATLEIWGSKYWTPEIISALHTAAGLSTNPEARAYIEQLLEKQGA